MTPARRAPRAHRDPSTSPPPRHVVVLLGPQRFDPTLGEAVAALGIDGRIATVTAGWQERETDDRDLQEHLKGGTVNLRLHARAEEVFKEDPPLAAAYRARQVRLRHQQDFYRIRCEYALEAARVISKRAADPDLLARERESSMEAIRTLDMHHLRMCDELHAELDERWRPNERPAIARHRDEIGRILEESAGLAIAGGHVAVLLNRLRMFDVAPLLREQPIFAWSAGAMAVSEKIVLFHDDPPYGSALEEVLDKGLGLCTGVVPLPHCNHRLRLDDRERVAMFARRFAPAMCLAMPNNVRITYRNGRWVEPHGIRRLGLAGDVEDVLAA